MRNNNIIKQLFCKHNWILGHEIKRYINYKNQEVYIWRCVCSKCNKWSNRKST